MAKATTTPNHTLEVNSIQLAIIKDALDLYVRIGLGQFERVTDVYDPRTGAQMEALTRALKDAKQVVGHPANGSYGINHPAVSNPIRTAYDMQRECDAVNQGYPQMRAFLKGTEPQIVITTNTPPEFATKDAAVIIR